MNTIKIIRSKALSNSSATYGRMLFNGKEIAKTVEQPWHDNTIGTSCIPKGLYNMLPWNSEKHGEVVVFCNPSLNIYDTPEHIPNGVAGRSLCLIHSANYASELKGCVAPGNSYMYNTNKQVIGVTASKNTITLLQSLWGDRKNLTTLILWE